MVVSTGLEPGRTHHLDDFDSGPFRQSLQPKLMTSWVRRVAHTGGNVEEIGLCCLPNTGPLRLLGARFRPRTKRTGWQFGHQRAEFGAYLRQSRAVDSILSLSFQPLAKVGSPSLCPGRNASSRKAIPPTLCSTSRRGASESPWCPQLERKRRQEFLRRVVLLGKAVSSASLSEWRRQPRTQTASFYGSTSGP
jgi:hypothetical protein